MLYEVRNESDAAAIYVLRFEDGESFPDRLLEFVEARDIGAGSFTGIGAVSGCRIAYFDVLEKEYQEIDLDEQLEVLALVGNVAIHEARPLVHAHVTLGRRDGGVVGGHLVRGAVRPTLELTLRAFDAALGRRIDTAYGLPGLDLENRF